MNVYAKFGLAIGLTVSLGGCQSVFGHFALFSAKQPHRPAPSILVDAAPLTSQGRHELDAGRIGLAIEAFQRALSSGESPGPVLNGLGVSFARLGRTDLALRFFQEALALEPANQNYAINLEVLTKSPAFALRHEGDVTEALANASTSGISPDPAALPAAREARLGQLSRVSSHEFEIRTVAPQPAPLGRARTAALPRFQPLVRIDLSKEHLANTSTSSLPAKGGTETRPKVLTFRNFRPAVRIELKSSTLSAEHTPRSGAGVLEVAQAH